MVGRLRYHRPDLEPTFGPSEPAAAVFIPRRNVITRLIPLLWWWRAAGADPPGWRDRHPGERNNFLCVSR